MTGIALAGLSSSFWACTRTQKLNMRTISNGNLDGVSCLLEPGSGFEGWTVLGWRCGYISIFSMDIRSARVFASQKFFEPRTLIFEGGFWIGDCEKVRRAEWEILPQK